MGLEKLKIIPLKKNISKSDPEKEFDKGKAIECQFNPETITMSKSLRYAFRPDIGDSTPETVFSGGESGSMTLELIFDTTKDGTDVRKKYYDLVQISLVMLPATGSKTKGEPRQVVIQWGSFMSYVAVIESLSQTFNYFLPDGTPLRANVSLTLREILDKSDTKLPGQNPTSRTDVRQTWVVEKGQRIEWIAYNVYGATSAWRHIAESNDLLNPAVLRPGQILKLVPLR